MHGHHPDEPTFCLLDGEGLSLEELEAMSKLDLTKEASDHGIGNNKGFNLALFPHQKKNIINELMAKFDEEHSESVLAANLESEGAAKIIIQRMSAKVGAVEKERSPSRVSTTGVVAKAFAEAEPTFEVDDDRSMNNIVILEKVVINELTLALSSLALDAVNSHGINPDKIYVTFPKDKADNTSIEDIFQNTNSTDVARLYLWERVVSASVVATFESPVGDPSRILSRHRLDPGWVGERRLRPH